MPEIVVQNLSKTYRVADKQPGLIGSLRHLIRRRYRDIPAVREVGFSIEPGEIVGFLGPNGAGKTTTLKMLTGLLHPTRGRIDIHGHRPFDRRHDFLRRITLVMGNKQQLIWDLPTLDSLRINAAVYDLGDDDLRRRTDELARMLELGQELTQPVRKLSLGQRMKVELLAALIHRPSILFLDEPTLGLDVNAQSAVRSFLREYNRRYGATLLLTSHYMADITALCPRVLIIHQGRLMYDGALSGILERFAPYREVKLELPAPAPHHDTDPPDHSPAHPGAIDWSVYGELESVREREVRLIVRRDQLTSAVTRLLRERDIADLTITDPPIEEIIGRLFTAGTTETPSEREASATVSPDGR